jgi:hypothetical protein
MTGSDHDSLAPTQSGTNALGRAFDEPVLVKTFLKDLMHEK